MKFLFSSTFLMLFVLLQTTNLMAKELAEYQAEAAQYYEAGDYKKAYKSYYKLAKIGDHKSQYQVAHMNAHGEGRKVNFVDAYGWSAVAAESGNSKAISKSEQMLEHNSDKVAAQKRADKLMKKYGKKAQKKRAEMIARQDAGRRSGSCVGSRLTCQKGSAYDAPLTGGSITLPGSTGTN